MSLIVLPNEYLLCTFNGLSIEFRAVNKRAWSLPSLCLIKGQVRDGAPKVFPPKPHQQSCNWETSRFSYLETERRETDYLLCVRDCRMHKYMTSSNFHNHHRRFLSSYWWENWVSENAKSLVQGHTMKLPTWDCLISKSKPFHYNVHLQHAGFTNIISLICRASPSTFK